MYALGVVSEIISERKPTRRVEISIAILDHSGHLKQRVAPITEPLEFHHAELALWQLLGPDTSSGVTSDVSPQLFVILCHRTLRRRRCIPRLGEANIVANRLEHRMDVYVAGGRCRGKAFSGSQRLPFME